MKDRKSGKRKIWLAVLLLTAFLCQGCGEEKVDLEGTVSGNTVTTVDSGATVEGLLEETTADEEETEEMSAEEPAGDEPEEDGQTVSLPENTLATPAVCGALHVEGTQLTDSNGNPVQLRGISTHGLAWFPGYVNEDCFKQFREEWNVNVIRLAMYTAEYGGYCSGGNRDELEKLIAAGVEYATKNDIYVIIDWHILTDLTPDTYKEEAKEFFAKMSQNYAGYHNVIYEICNEPNGGTTWSEVKAYAETIIPVIRENDEDALILVGTPNWCQYVEQAAADPITGYENIMYTLHFYASTHTDWLRDAMKDAVAAGLPIFVSEYGLSEASGDGRVDTYQADLWAAAMDELNISYVAWNLSNKNESSSLIKSSCNKVSGFTTEDLNESGKWLYGILTESGVQASIPVPEREDVPKQEKLPKTETAAEQETAPEAVVAGDLAYTVTVSNSWSSGDKTFYQYGLNIENTSESDVTNWTLELIFNGDVGFDSGWNGNFTADKTQLTITPAAYNATIPAGGTLSDIGFIISGAGNLQLIK